MDQIHEIIPEMLSNTYVVILCKQGCEIINVKTNLIFIIKLFFLHAQKVKTKT